MSRIPQTDWTDKKLGRYSSIWYRGVRLTQFLEAPRAYGHRGGRGAIDRARDADRIGDVGRFNLAEVGF
jgi:hypothetical protein